MLPSREVVVFALLRPISLLFIAAPKPKELWCWTETVVEPLDVSDSDPGGCVDNDTVELERYLSISSDTFFSLRALSLIGPNSRPVQ